MILWSNFSSTFIGSVTKASDCDTERRAFSNISVMWIWTNETNTVLTNRDETYFFEATEGMNGSESAVDTKKLWQAGLIDANARTHKIVEKNEQVDVK